MKPPIDRQILEGVKCGQLLKRTPSEFLCYSCFRGNDLIRKYLATEARSNTE